MPNITLTFLHHINISAQIGDTAYYVPTEATTEFQVNSDEVVMIGKILGIDEVAGTITCSTNLSSSLYPGYNDFILFSKDNKANMSSLLGYYAEVTLRNDSKGKAEMFQVSADYFDSSK